MHPNCLHLHNKQLRQLRAYSSKCPVSEKTFALFYPSVHMYNFSSPSHLMNSRELAFLSYTTHFHVKCVFLSPALKPRYKGCITAHRPVPSITKVVKVNFKAVLKRQQTNTCFNPLTPEKAFPQSNYLQLTIPSVSNCLLCYSAWWPPA